jgi:hypothetical protein
MDSYGSYIIMSTINGESYFWNGHCWDEQGKAQAYSESFAERQAGILRANNRWLEEEDQANNIRIIKV